MLYAIERVSKSVLSSQVLVPITHKTWITTSEKRRKQQLANVKHKIGHLQIRRGQRDIVGYQATKVALEAYRLIDDDDEATTEVLEAVAITSEDTKSSMKSKARQCK